MMCNTPGAPARIRWQTAMHKPTYSGTPAAWVGGMRGCVGGGPRKGAFTRRARMQSGGHNKQPRLTIRLGSSWSSRSSHVQSWRPARCPRFRLISAPLCRKKQNRCTCCAWPKATAIPNKLGPVGEGREDRHQAKTSGPPPLPLTGIRAQPCHLNSAVSGTSGTPVLRACSWQLFSAKSSQPLPRPFGGMGADRDHPPLPPDTLPDRPDKPSCY